MYEELIRRLREEPLDSNKAALPIMDLCIDAATAIENLSHRLDMAQGERDAVTRHMIELESSDGQVRKALHDKGFDNLDMLFEDYSQVKNELASYKNTGLEPKDIISAVDMAKIACALHELNAYKDIGPIDHLRDLLQAEKAGRLVVLPCGTDVELERDGHTFKADHWNHTLTAFRDAPENKSGKQVALFSIKEAEAALAQKGGKDHA